MIKIIIRIIVLFFVLLFFFSAFLVFKLYQSVDSDTDVIISIKSNNNIKATVNSLNSVNLLKPGWLFKPALKIYLSLTDEKIFSGVYKFGTVNTNLEIIRAITTGKQRYIVKVTYPEGITLSQFASISKKNLQIDSTEFIKYIKTKTLLDKYKINSKTPEGYLMPETYFFYWNQPVNEIADRLLDEQNNLWNKKFSKSTSKSDLSKHQILTLASIVEAESPLSAERPIIAGVYLNRLKKNMKLEADPTVAYILNGKKHLTYNDLDINSPYNTYRNIGLPPGPINSPSESSIRSVLFPDKNNYLYFVAYGDGSGRHLFAKSYSEHLANKLKYKRNLRSIK